MDKKITKEILEMVTKKLDFLKSEDVSLAAFCCICDDERNHYLTKEQERMLERITFSEMVKDYKELKKLI